MTDPIKLSTDPIPSVAVTLIGTGDGGTPLTTGTTGITPDHQPNVVVTVITPIVAILVRFANAYFTALVGLVSAGMVSTAIPAADFGHLVFICAKLSLAGASLGALKDVVTIFSKLEQKYPIGTGSV